jgi:hypothetical protein
LPTSDSMIDSTAQSWFACELNPPNAVRAHLSAPQTIRGLADFRDFTFLDDP